MRDRASRLVIVPAALASILLAVVAVGCNTKASEKRQGGVALARVGGEVVTEAELPAPMRTQIEQAERKLFETKLRVVRSVVEAKLFASAAKKKGTTVESFERDLVSKVEEPTVAEVEAAIQKPPYSQSLEAQLAQAKTEEEKAGARARVSALVSAKLRRERMERVRQELQDSLRREAGVEILIEAPRLARVEIPLEGAPTRGPAQATVTVVGFVDMGPVYCQMGRGAVDSLVSAHSGEVRYAVKFFPSQARPMLRRAAEVAVCAGEQRKLWEFHDAFCAEPPVSDARAVAEKARLDLKALDQCLSSGHGASGVEKDIASAKALGVTASPTFFLNGVAVGPNTLEDLTSLYTIETLRKS